MRTYCKGWRVEVEAVFGTLVNEVECFRRGNIYEVYDNGELLFSDSYALAADEIIKKRVDELQATAKKCGFTCTVNRIR